MEDARDREREVRGQDGPRFFDTSGGSGLESDIAPETGPQSAPDSLRILRALTPPGGRVLDLGAHLGDLSLTAADEGYEVISVEASCDDVARLEAGAALRGHGRLRVVHAVVADRPRAIDPRAGNAEPRESPARVIHGDGLLDEMGWSRLDFIRIDVDGSAVEAVRGLTRALSHPDGPTVLYESDGPALDAADRTPQDLKRGLVASGYRNYLVKPGRLIPVGADDFQASPRAEYLAIKGHEPRVPGWALETGLDPEELLDDVLAAFESPDPAERSYILHGLARGPAAIRTDRRVAAAIESARSDPDEGVRTVAWRLRKALRPAHAAWWWPVHRSRSA